MCLLIIALLLVAGAPHAWAGKPKPEIVPPPEEEYVQGAILDAATNKPLDGATVAIRTRKGAVLSWGKTGAKGDFRVQGKYITSVKLPAYKEKDQSLLGQIVRGADSVFTLAARSATSLVKPVARAAASAVAGPVVGQVAGAVADTVVPSQDRALEWPDPDNAAIFTVKVTCPGYVDYVGPVQAYWMTPPDPDQKRILTFWLDPVMLAPRGDEVKLRSGPRAIRMRLRNGAVEPSIAPRGSEVVVSVQLEVPQPADGCVKVLARNDRTGDLALLLPVKGKPNLYSGTMQVAEEWPLNDQRIVLLALRCLPASPQGPRAGTPEDLAEKLSLWRSRKLIFDPQILASRDREALLLTVVERAGESAPPPAEPGKPENAAPPKPKR